MRPPNGSHEQFSPRDTEGKPERGESIDQFKGTATADTATVLWTRLSRSPSRKSEFNLCSFDARLSSVLLQERTVGQSFVISCNLLQERTVGQSLLVFL